MAIFSVNQNRQFYCATKLVTVTPAAEGEIMLGQTKDNKQIYFKFYGKAGLSRTDLIDVDKITYAKITTAANMQRKLRKATVTLNADINEGKPIVGQDYVMRVQINNYLSPGDASVLIKTGAVHAVKGMDAEAFYKKMADSLTRNFNREDAILLKFEGSSTGLTITELGDQPWRLGVLSQEPVNFEVYPTTIMSEGEEVIWGSVVYADTATTVGNGRQVADLEYFCQAERGDMFRNMGWPNNIDVKYMVDPTKEYDMLDLHYFYSGDGVQVHKSEKDLTIVSATAAVLTGIKTALAKLNITVE